jgi:hypothetical protein
MASARFIIAIALVGVVDASGDGDDFSNNLISDLAPYVLLAHLVQRDVLMIICLGCWHSSVNRLQSNL